MKQTKVLSILLPLMVLVSCLSDGTAEKSRLKIASFDSLFNQVRETDSIFVQYATRENEYYILHEYPGDYMFGFFRINTKSPNVDEFCLVCKMPDDFIYPDTCEVLIKYRQENDTTVKEIRTQGNTFFINPILMRKRNSFIFDKTNIRIILDDNLLSQFDKINDRTSVRVYFPQARHNTGYSDLDSAFDKIGCFISPSLSDKKHIKLIRDQHKKLKMND